MIALASSVFVAGLLGSAHCAGMCGSFACLASGGDASGGRRALRSTAAYNGGRLLSYALLGALAGAAGAGLNRAGAVAGWARPAAVVAGILLILWGLASLAAALGLRIPLLDVPPALATRVAKAVRAVQERPPALRALAIGALSAALPCGWLYAFVATSAAAGSALGGATVMAAFWLGTLPLMAAVGLGAQRLLGRFRTRLPVVTASVLVILGVLTVAGRLTVTPSHSHAAEPAASAEHDGHDAHD
ncbi:MAG: sulfite exporter TauE/SafE family protein [Gemmatimonadaceae bacterium]|nr:sulfite exporter TauE/SafE family protein [Gemmatimonadaceae bacterium]MCW5827267.1 sulfite exporter TauE/SafE family protein [Gemmatimonadaceae bacterium]